MVLGHVAEGRHDFLVHEHNLHLLDRHLELFTHLYLLYEWNRCHRLGNASDHLVGDDDWRDIWFTEESIVNIFLLCAEAERPIVDGIVAASLHHNFLARVNEVRLSLDLVLDDLLNEADAEHILDLDSIGLLATFATLERDVHIAPHLTFFHVGIRDIESSQHLLKFLDG
jgi:hypothetical protein